MFLNALLYAPVGVHNWAGVDTLSFWFKEWQLLGVSQFLVR